MVYYLPNQGTAGDDSSVHGIHIRCENQYGNEYENNDGGWFGDHLKSFSGLETSGPDGKCKRIDFYTEGFINGARLKSVEKKGSYDDLATTNVEMSCTKGDIKKDSFETRI